MICFCIPIGMFHFHHVRGGSGLPSGGTGDAGAGGGGGGGGKDGGGGATSTEIPGANGPKNGFVPSAGCIFDATTVPMWPGNGTI